MMHERMKMRRLQPHIVREVRDLDGDSAVVAGWAWPLKGEPTVWPPRVEAATEGLGLGDVAVGSYGCGYCEYGW
jgi:hypothetical protein